jgi:hypothetical protein
MARDSTGMENRACMNSPSLPVPVSRPPAGPLPSWDRLPQDHHHELTATLAGMIPSNCHPAPARRARPAMSSDKILPQHLERKAYVYVRQSGPRQVEEHLDSQDLQYQLVHRAQALGWATS